MSVSIVTAINEVSKNLNYIFYQLHVISKISRLRKPGRVFLKLISESGEGMLKFVLVLPVKSAPDVVSRELTLQVGGNDPVNVTLDGNVVETPEYVGEKNGVLVGSLVDVDDAGNRSESRDFEFVLLDTIAPPMPGQVGVVVTGQDFVVDPVDPVDPEPTE